MKYISITVYCIHSIYKIRDLFRVYLNIFEFHFSKLHVYKINDFCFLLNIRRVPCMTK